MQLYKALGGGRQLRGRLRPELRFLAMLKSSYQDRRNYGIAYASTKGALEPLVKNWAAILGPQGIRVNAVAPGVIDTDMSNFTKTHAGREATLGMQALKRIGKSASYRDAEHLSHALCWIVKSLD